MLRNLLPQLHACVMHIELLRVPILATFDPLNAQYEVGHKKANSELVRLQN